MALGALCSRRVQASDASGTYVQGFGPVPFAGRAPQCTGVALASTAEIVAGKYSPGLPPNLKNPLSSVSLVSDLPVLLSEDSMTLCLSFLPQFTCRNPETSPLSLTTTLSKLGCPGG